MKRYTITQEYTRTIEVDAGCLSEAIRTAKVQAVKAGEVRLTQERCVRIEPLESKRFVSEV